MRTREDRLLQTVATLTDSLVDDFDVVDLLQLLVEESAEIFGAVAAGILLVGPTGQLEVIVSTNESREFVGLMQLRAGEGPCDEAVATGKAVSLKDLAHVDARWSRFAADARESGFGSLHAIPMRLRDTVIGSLNLFRDRVGELTGPDAAAAETLADIATIGILQQHVVERNLIAPSQLRHAFGSRIVIEQATGYIAQSQDLDMDAAFHLILAHARSTRTQFSAVAAAITSGRLSSASLTGGIR